MKEYIQLVIIALVIGLMTFYWTDTLLGEKETTTECVTVLDTYSKTERLGKSWTEVYYIKIDTDKGKKNFTVTPSQFDKIEKNSEIEVKIITVRTKWTNKTKVYYFLKD